MKRIQCLISKPGLQPSIMMVAGTIAFMAVLFTAKSGNTADLFPFKSIVTDHAGIVAPDGDTTKNALPKQYVVDDTIVQAKREIELEIESGKIIKAIVDGEEIPENSLRTHGFHFVDRDTTVMKRIVVRTNNPRFRNIIMETNSLDWQGGDSISMPGLFEMQIKPKALLLQQRDAQDGFTGSRITDSLLFFMPEIDSLRLRVGALALDSLSRQRFLTAIDSILMLHSPRFEKGFPFEREKVLRRYVPDSAGMTGLNEMMELREREDELRRLQTEIARMNAGLELDSKRLQTEAIQLEIENMRKEIEERRREIEGMKLNIPRPVDQFTGDGREFKFILEKEQPGETHGIESSHLKLFKDELVEQGLAKSSSLVVLTPKQTIIDGWVVEGRVHRKLIRRFEELTGHKLEKGQAVTVR